jgi:hypothetical protein
MQQKLAKGTFVFDAETCGFYPEKKCNCGGRILKQFFCHNSYKEKKNC